MKNRFLLFGLVFLVATAFTLPSLSSSDKPVSAASAASGIKFEKMTAEQALKEARSSGKLIFIDVHTSWCGPCKEMARTTFQSEEVGKVFNKKFINLKIDAEKDADGPDISRTYGVTAYPTLLFINGDGKLVKKLIGKQSEEKLLSIVEKM
jgi:thioredoxin 1